MAKARHHYPAVYERILSTGQHRPVELTFPRSTTAARTRAELYSLRKLLWKDEVYGPESLRVTMRVVSNEDGTSTLRIEPTGWQIEKQLGDQLSQLDEVPPHEEVSTTHTFNLQSAIDSYLGEEEK